MGNHYRMLEQSEILSCTCPAENTDSAACASQTALVSPCKHLCVAPYNSQTLCSCPCPSLSAPKDALVRTLSRCCTNPQTAGLMETFPKCFSVQLRHLLGKSLLQAFLPPRQLHPTVWLQDCASQKGSPQLI